MDNTTTTNNEAYNGWSNNETWLTSVWLGSMPELQAILQEAISQPGTKNNKAGWLEQELETYLQVELDEMYDSNDGEPYLWSNLLAVAFSRINWRELVEEG